MGNCTNSNEVENESRNFQLLRESSLIPDDSSQPIPHSCKPILASFQKGFFNTLSCGSNHCVVRKPDGKMISFGVTSFGETSQTSTLKCEFQPKVLSLPNNMRVRDISCGGKAIFMIGEDERLYCCGFNDKGMLGMDVGINTTISSPRMNPTLKNESIMHISVGVSHTLITTKKNECYGMGYCFNGQLGIGKSRTTLKLPTLINKEFFNGENIVSTSAGGWHSYWISEKGKCFSAGFNSNGQCSTGNRSYNNKPFPINCHNEVIIKIASGGCFSIFLCKGGKVYSCGNNNRGQLGLSTNLKMNQLSMENINALNHIFIVDIYVGYATSFFIDNTGGIYSCGANDHHQTGLQKGEVGKEVCIPTKVNHKVPSTLKDIDCSTASTILSFQNGDVYGVGKTKDFEYDKITLLFNSNDVIITGKKKEKLKSLGSLLIQNVKGFSDHSDEYKKIISKGKAFTDTNFPPNDDSHGLKKKKPTWNFEWSRSGQKIYMNSNVFVEQDNSYSPVVKQGSVGNCWFISAIESLSQHPKLINRIVLTKEKNKVGCFEVQLFKHGMWKRYIVDDFFPYWKGSRVLGFAAPLTKNLWPIIVEKAYAKSCRSYAAMNSGNSWIAISQMTGAPAVYISLREEGITNIVKKFGSKGIMKIILSPMFNLGVACGTVAARTEEAKKNGLVKGHCYSLLDVSEKYNLVCIRNPHGGGEWKGDYSDKCSKWTNEMKRELNLIDKNDGKFWMSIKDWAKYFLSLEVCYVGMIEKYQMKEILLTPFEKVSISFKVHHKSTKISFGFVQCDSRGRNDLPHTIGCGFVILNEKGNQILKYAGIKNSKVRFVLDKDNDDWIHSVTLNKGTYKLVPLIPWPNDENILRKFIRLSINWIKGKRIDFLKKETFNVDNIPQMMIENISFWNDIGKHRTSRNITWSGNTLTIHKYGRFDEFIYWLEWSKINPKHSVANFVFKVSFWGMREMVESKRKLKLFKIDHVENQKMNLIGWYGGIARKRGTSYGYEMSFRT